MGRGKIKRETKREKIDFRLGGIQEEGESKVLPYNFLHVPLLSTPISSRLMSTMHLVMITILMTTKLLELSLIRDMRTTQR